jgi:hypothetical protein
MRATNGEAQATGAGRGRGWLRVEAAAVVRHAWLRPFGVGGAEKLGMTGGAEWVRLGQESCLGASDWETAVLLMPVLMPVLMLMLMLMPVLMRAPQSWRERRRQSVRTRQYCCSSQRLSLLKLYYSTCRE